MCAKRFRSCKCHYCRWFLLLIDFILEFVHTKDVLIEKNGNKRHGDMLLLPHIECRKRIRYQLIINAHVNAVCALLPIIRSVNMKTERRVRNISLFSDSMADVANQYTYHHRTHAHVHIQAVCFIVLSLKYFPLVVFIWKMNTISIHKRRAFHVATLILAV